MGKAVRKKRNNVLSKDVAAIRRAYFGRLETEPPITHLDLHAAEEVQRRLCSHVVDRIMDELCKCGRVTIEATPS